MIRKYCRGDIWYYNWGDLNSASPQDHVMKKCRPSVILSADINNDNNSVVTIAAITSSDKSTKEYACVQFESNSKSINAILLNQVRTVNKYELTEYFGRLTDDVMKQVDKVLAKQFDIDVFDDSEIINKLMNKISYNLNELISDKINECYASVDKIINELNSFKNSLVFASKLPEEKITPVIVKNDELSVDDERNKDLEFINKVFNRAFKYNNLVECKKALDFINTKDIKYICELGNLRPKQVYAKKFNLKKILNSEA